MMNTYFINSLSCIFALIDKSTGSINTANDPSKNCIPKQTKLYIIPKKIVKIVIGITANKVKQHSRYF